MVNLLVKTFLFVFISTFGHRYNVSVESSVNIKSSNNRAPASTISPISCVQTFKMLISDAVDISKNRTLIVKKSAKKSPKKPEKNISDGFKSSAKYKVADFIDPTPALNQLRGLSFNLKLAWFKRWARAIKDDSKRQKSFAHIFNEAVKKGITSPEEALQMIKDLKKELKIPFLKLRIGGVIKPDDIISELKTLDGPLRLHLDYRNSLGESAQGIMEDLARSLMPKSKSHVRVSFKDRLRQLDLNPEDLTLLRKALQEVNLPAKDFSKEVDTIISYGHYVKGLFPDQRAAAIDELPAVLGFGKKTADRHAKKFEKVMRKDVAPFKLKKRKQFVKKRLKKLKKTKPGMSKEQRLKNANHYADEEVRKLGNDYENQVFSCRSKMSNRFNRGSGKAFGNVLLGINLAALLTSYGVLKGSDPWGLRDAKRLSFDVVMTVVLTKLTANIFSNPRTTPIDRWVTGNLTYAALTAPNYTDAVVDGGLFGLIVGEDETEAREHLKEILSQPGAKEELAALVRHLDEKQIISKIRTYLEGIDLDNPPEKFVEFMQEQRELRGEELEQAEVLRDIYLEAMAEKSYEEKSSIIKTGSPSMDIYLYNRLYELYGVGSTLFVSSKMLGALCSNHGNHWAKRYGIAALIYTLNKAIHTPLYLEGRERFTGEI